MRADTTNVVVVGGGYAGVMAANRLTQRADVAVTLINARPTFVHRIRLHQLVAGSHDAVVEYRKVLSTRVRLVVGSVTRINPAERTATLATGDSIAYDYPIYAVGSRSAAPSVPGAVEFAHEIAGLEEAERTRAVLDTAPLDAPVTVVGAGATGLEVSSELAEAGRNVTLVAGRVLNPYLHPRVRRKVEKRLAQLGVTVLDGPGASVTAVTRDAVQLADGRSVPSAVTLWTAGFSLPELAAASGLGTDADGRLLTDETLTSVSDERIVAAGDSAAPSDLPLRMSMQAALPQGAHAADTVLRRIAGQEPTPIDIALFFQCISLGRRVAAVQLASRQDVANRFVIGGRLGAKIKNDSFTRLIDELTREAHEPGSYRWRFKNHQRQQQVLASRDGSSGRRADGRAVRGAWSLSAARHRSTIGSVEGARAEPTPRDERREHEVHQVEGDERSLVPAEVRDHRADHEQHPADGGDGDEDRGHVEHRGQGQAGHGEELEHSERRHEAARVVLGPLSPGDVSQLLLRHERLADAARQGDDGEQAGDDPEREVHDGVLRLRWRDGVLTSECERS
jgi:NADH dehydrogenase FAD-containing subunit